MRTRFSEQILGLMFCVNPLQSRGLKIFKSYFSLKTMKKYSILSSAADVIGALGLRLGPV